MTPSTPQDNTLQPFSIVIPVYNEENGIGATLDAIKEICRTLPVPYEIITVDDGSTDRTADVLSNYSGYSDLRAIAHVRNRGYGAALKTGIRHAQYPLIVITDADGTYPNERIPDLIALAARADMVVGARTGKNVQYSKLRSIPKYFLVRFAQWIARSPIPDLNSGLRVFRKPIVEKFLHILPDGFSFTTTITLAMLTNNYIVVYEPIDYFFRTGKSKIRPIRDTLKFVQLILRTGVYFAPLRIFLPFALAFFAAFLVSLGIDVFVQRDLTESTLILMVAASQTAMFALLADMLDKRTR